MFTFFIETPDFKIFPAVDLDDTNTTESFSNAIGNPSKLLLYRVPEIVSYLDIFQHFDIWNNDFRGISHSNVYVYGF